jgi:hypothetical protein
MPIARSEFMNCPPSCRLPPLREGNRARVRFPLRAGGTLRRGSSLSLIFANYGCAIGIVSVFALVFQMPPSQPPPWTGEEPRLPPRPRGGLGWGLCLNLTAKTLISRTLCVSIRNHAGTSLRDNAARVGRNLLVACTREHGALGAKLAGAGGAGGTVILLTLTPEQTLPAVRERAERVIPIAPSAPGLVIG